MPLNFRFVTSGASLDDALTVTQTLRGESLKPLAPVNITGLRDLNSNLLIQWIRRARIGAGLRPGAGMPIAEEAESYEADIYSGANIVRIIKVGPKELEPPMWITQYYHSGSPEL